MKHGDLIMRQLMSFFLGAVFLVCLCPPALAERDLFERDWSINSPHSLGQYPPSEAEVEKLANKAIDTSWTTPICSFRFIDVGDGDYRLVVSLDVNGHHACQQLAVIQKDGPYFNINNNFRVVGADNVGDLLRDLDNDHRPELIVPQAWSLNEGGGKCVATWLRIFRWQGKHFADASAFYPNFYKERLKQLQAAASHESDASCVEMEMDRIARVTGNSTAGFDRALAWMSNPDPLMRRRAATVFADIGDPTSKANLMILAKDSDPLTADAAQRYLDTPFVKE